MFEQFFFAKVQIYRPGTRKPEKMCIYASIQIWRLLEGCDET